MIEAGIISAKEAETHPKANIITRAVGAHDILELELATYDVDENDQFLLCSDGLNKVMSDTEILNFVSHCPFEGVADVFIEQAISRQARDNVTVILVQHKNHKADFLRETLPLDATLPLNTR
jgi:serine/threonine protein phosphatase PrpC